MRLLGVVLAGGASRRFGSDKAVALLAGRPLLAHALAGIAGQVADVAVAGRDWPGVRRIDDLPRPGLGPLGGLCGALADAMRDGYDAVVSVPCDVPDLPADLVARLRAAGTPSYVPALPVIGLWPSIAGRALLHRLDHGDDRSMRSWAADIGARPVLLPVLPRNINHRADLTEA